VARHKPQKKSLAGRGQLTPGGTTPASPADFDEVLALIEAARTRALAAVNQELVGLYWLSARNRDPPPSPGPASKMDPPQPHPFQ
jgi:hypothetical protein